MCPKIDDVIAYLQAVKEKHGNVEVHLDKDGWMEDDFPPDVTAATLVAERGLFEVFTYKDETTLFINN